LDRAIEKFFDERKSAWLKSRIKGTMTDEQKKSLEVECEDRFALENWLPDAAKRVTCLAMVTHSGKYSHPSIKKDEFSSILAEAAKRNDGFLRTGNSPAPLEVFVGNAAALDVYKFLDLELGDGKKLVNHLEENSDTIKKQFAIRSVSFEEIREGLLSIKRSTKTASTDGRVKQVYFPCNKGYHLLSVLTPSGLMFELRNRVNDIRFSERSKDARERRRKGECSEAGFDDLFNLTVIGYGGSKPQNIGVLNSKYGGKAYLLPCMPPTLEKRKARIPRRNFFENSL